MKFVPKKLQLLIDNDNGYIKIANILIALNGLLMGLSLLGIFLLFFVSWLMEGSILGAYIFLIPLFMIAAPVGLIGTLYSLYFAGKFRLYKKAIILFLISGGPFVIAGALSSC